MVESRMNLVRIVNGGSVRYVVEAAGTGVRRRIVFQTRRADNPEAGSRNDIPRKGLPLVSRRIQGGGIVDRRSAREVTGSLVWSRHAQILRYSLRRPQSFVVDHEECLIADDRAAHHAAELVPV